MVKTIFSHHYRRYVDMGNCFGIRQSKKVKPDLDLPPRNSNEDSFLEYVRLKKEIATTFPREMRFGYPRWGDSVPDDLINVFINRVKPLISEKVDACLAVQAVNVTPDLMPRFIRGKNRALQIILDHDRHHYLLAEWVPQRRKQGIAVYDSMSADYFDFVLTLTPSSMKQLVDLFGHLYPKGKPMIQLFSVQDVQHDGWSCGFRVVALFVAKLFFGSKFRVADAEIHLTAFSEVFQAVVNSKEPLTFDDLRFDEWFSLHPPIQVQSIIFRLEPNCNILTIAQNFAMEWKDSYKNEDLLPLDDDSIINNKKSNVKKVKISART